MDTFTLTLRMIGSLCMFLFGMKTMSNGLQKSAGDRMRKTLNFMTGNRFIGVLTGFTATAIIQSSTAFSVIIVSFVNVGLITLTQSIGVIFGLNIGTTLTGWIISILGFKISIDALALPAVGIGFIISIIKWKYRSIGDFFMGFGFLFLGLHFLTSGMANVNDVFNFDAIGALRHSRVLAILIGVGIGFIMTIIINSSSASITLIMALAFQDIINYEMAAGMVMGANLGTVLNAVLVSLAGNINAKRAALVHVMFNIIGLIWALPLLIPLLNLVNMILPGDPWVAGPYNDAIPLHIAGLHTTYNIINTIVFLPFVNQFAKFITFVLPARKTEKKDEVEHYKFEYLLTGNTDSPEFNIMRAEKEISDMAGIVSFMYSRFSTVLRNLNEENGNNEENTTALCAELKRKEEYIDEMRDELSSFLTEFSMSENTSRRSRSVGSKVIDSIFKPAPHTKSRVSSLLRIIVTLEEMSDECYTISRVLERSVRKNRVFKTKEMDELIPYVGYVEEFLALLENQLGRNPIPDPKNQAIKLEKKIDKNRKKLHKLGRKRIEAGKDVKTELLFIDLVRRIERLGNYCFEISEAL
ncbi:MAG: Na/Pi symporter [Treponema sp.]|jgi:phosphate:Na+ symporter|nr:Na/Pi symporter [Treponema sp.]